MSQGVIDNAGSSITNRVTKRKMSRKLKIILLVAAVLVAALAVWWFFFRSSTTAALKQQFATVTRGDFSISITGSAPIVSSNKRDISPKVGGTITKVNFLKGDKIKAGDLLFEIDDVDAVTSLQNAQNSYEQTRLQLNSNLNDLGKTSISAPFSGQVTNIQVKAGDNVGKGATILTLTDLSKFKVSIPFNAASIGSIKAGQTAVLHIADLMQSTTGTVTYVNDKPFASANGGQVVNVEIRMNNPGALSKGLRASADISTSTGTQTSTDYGTLDFVNYEVIKTDNGGIVQSIPVKENQIISAGTLLVSFQNDSLTLTKQTTDSKLQALAAQVETAKKTVDNYKVYSQIDGVITKQSVKVGDVCKAGDVLSTVSNNDLMEFSIAIDELDIQKVKVGQNVNISIDALPETTNRPLTGTVTDIAIDGTTTSGVTTYPVTISINGNGQLKGGMNANAQIIIDQRTNVLRLPLNAVSMVRRRSTVWVLGDPKAVQNAQAGARGGQNPQGNAQGGQNPQDNAPGGQNPPVNTQGAQNGQRQGGQNGQRQAAPSGQRQGGQQNAAAANPQIAAYYANAIQKPVQVGLNNEDFIEILGGLNEGDKVLLPPVFTNSSTSTTGATTGRAPGMGGMGGGFGGMGGPPPGASGGGQQRQGGGGGGRPD